MPALRFRQLLSHVATEIVSFDASDNVQGVFALGFLIYE